MTTLLNYVEPKFDFQEIIYEKEQREKGMIAWMTVKADEKGFTKLSFELVTELKAAYEDADRDQRVGICVLTAQGRKVFNAGGDIDFMDALDFQTGQVWNRHLMELSTKMRNLRIPIILAANGLCIGGGNELNIFCDMTIAAENAVFGQAGPMVGACPVWGATQMLPRIVGEKRAREMIMCCQQYPAAKALEWGLANAVVPYEQLYDETRRWCDMVLDKSPNSIRIAKVSLNFESDLLYPSMTAGSVYLSYLWGSPQTKEGFGSFKEKRKNKNWGQFRKNN